MEKLKGKLSPEALDANHTTIWHHAFSYCGLTSVTLGENVREIGKNAFNDCHPCLVVNSATEEHVGMLIKSGLDKCQILCKIQSETVGVALDHCYTLPLVKGLPTDLPQNSVVLGVPNQGSSNNCGGKAP